MKKILLMLSITLSFHSWASLLPQSKSEYCERFKSDSGIRNNIQDLALDTDNLMSFKNSGGLFNGGVCWWHSRFQRNILYLAIFRPDLPKIINPSDLKNLIHKIRIGDSVVEIPGHNNFSEFTEENKDQIQSELASWQLKDGIILGSWIDGLKGNSKVPGDQLLKMMNELYQYVGVEKKIAWEKLQIKGITSHAWLIVDIKKVDDGYDLGIIDSNYPSMSSLYSYKNGDQSFFVKSYGDFVPYLEFKREEERITISGEVFCNRKFISVDENQSSINDLLDVKEAKERQ